MARDKSTLANINLSDLLNWPNGRIKNNDGTGNGTPVNEFTYGDIHEFFAKAMRLYGIGYNGLPDNETNGYQLVEAIVSLASKNDFVLDLTTSSGVLNVPLKIGKLKVNESFILKAAVNKTTETNIKGTLDNASKSITFLGDFKAGEYVRMINTASSVVLVRMVDSFNLATILDELAYLKAATQAEENAGTIVNKATTPLTNKVSFIKRVNGVDSENYLAKPTGDVEERDGLLSHEDKKKIDDWGAPSNYIQVVQGVQEVSAPQNGDQSSNFNYNYIDVYPPTGFNMTHLKSVTAAHAYVRFSGDVDANDRMWVDWQADGTKLRIICGTTEFGAPCKCIFSTIWIKE